MEDITDNNRVGTRIEHRLGALGTVEAAAVPEPRRGERIVELLEYRDRLLAAERARVLQIDDLTLEVVLGGEGTLAGSLGREQIGLGDTGLTRRRAVEVHYYVGLEHSFVHEVAGGKVPESAPEEAVIGDRDTETVRDESRSQLPADVVEPFAEGADQGLRITV